jgi:hypothetical protein
MSRERRTYQVRIIGQWETYSGLVVISVLLGTLLQDLAWFLRLQTKHRGLTSKLSCLVSVLVCEDRAEIISPRISLIRRTDVLGYSRLLSGNRITNGGGDAEDIGGHH